MNKNSEEMNENNNEKKPESFYTQALFYTKNLNFD